MVCLAIKDNGLDYKYLNTCILEIEALTLDGIKRQIAVNIGLIAISGFVIYFSTSFANKDFVTWDSCLDAEFVFTLLSTILGSFGWRYAEKNSASLWDVVCAVFSVVLIIVYGSALAQDDNDVVRSMIRWAFWGFLLFYIVDNLIIVSHFKHKKEVADRKRKRQRNVDYIGYKRDQDDVKE